MSQLAAEPKVSYEGTVAVLSLGAQEGRFTAESVAAINACLDEVLGSDAHALVTVADGKIWSNGFDVDWLIANPDRAASTLQDTEKLFGRLLTFPVTTVAAIAGHVFAGGGMLALAHDIRLMRAERGFFCLPEIDLGVIFTDGMTALLQATMTPATTHRTMVLGERLGGPAAVEAGLASEALDLDALLPRAMELAATYGGRRREVVSAMKQRVYGDAVARLGAVPPTAEMLKSLGVG